MTHSRPLFTAGLSANDAFKLRYPRYLKGAAMAALILTALLVWLWPDIPARPYELRQKEEMILVDVPDPAPVIEPPRPLAQPRLPRIIEPVPDDDPTPVDPWEPPGFWDPPVPSAPDASIYDGFVASSVLPRLTAQARADYPEIARRSGLEGTVMVHVLVGPNGQVDQAVLIRGVHPLLDRAALDAARRCRFTPAKQRELSVKAWVAVPYRFRLR